MHAHDWPVLSLFVLGAYFNRTDVGERHICGPSAVLYHTGAHHTNAVGANGFEQIEIEFDPRWLGYCSLPRVPVAHWTGGRIGAAARTLAGECGKSMDEKQLVTALLRFLTLAVQGRSEGPPAWVDQVSRRLRENAGLRVTDLAKEVDRHPSWLGGAYQRAVGEGILVTAARLRVEHAVRLLRESDLSCCQVALDAGFCDQSHMNRSFRRLLDRSPSTVRNERLAFREFRGPAASQPPVSASRGSSNRTEIPQCD